MAKILDIYSLEALLPSLGNFSYTYVIYYYFQPIILYDFPQIVLKHHSRKFFKYANVENICYGDPTFNADDFCLITCLHCKNAVSHISLTHFCTGDQVAVLMFVKIPILSKNTSMACIFAMYPADWFELFQMWLSYSGLHSKNIIASLLCEIFSSMLFP